MQGHVTGTITLGFASLFLIGAAGAASDSYYETRQAQEMVDVICDGDLMARTHALNGSPNCSVHRASSTYGRQLMAMSMTRDREPED